MQNRLVARINKQCITDLTYKYLILFSKAGYLFAVQTVPERQLLVFTVFKQWGSHNEVFFNYGKAFWIMIIVRIDSSGR